MFTQVTNSARAFQREFDNETFRLVRSQASFEKFAAQEGIELTTKRGNSEGTLKRRQAIWSGKAGHGVIGTVKDVKKFLALCEEKEAAPVKRTRAVAEPVSKAPKEGRVTRGPKALVEKPAKEKVSSDVPKKLKKEPDISIAIDSELPPEHNLREAKRVLKAEFARLGYDGSASKFVDILYSSQNLKDFLVLFSQEVN